MKNSSINCVFLFIYFFSIYSYSELSQNEVSKLLLCYKNKIDSAQHHEEKIAIFSTFPEESFYKLFIDKKRLQNPKENEKNVSPHLIFDVEEPGYFASMIEAFQQLPNYIGKKISLDDIIELHDIATRKVTRVERGMLRGARYPVRYNAKPFRELLESGILLDPELFIKTLSEKPLYGADVGNIPSDFIGAELPNFLSEWIPSISAIRSRIDSREKLIKQLNPIIDHYYASISITNSMNGRLSAIAELLRALEVAHIFSDGNQRTYAFLLLPKLLIENGLPPAILERPDMFDGWATVARMTKMLKRGMSNFLNENADEQRNFLENNCQDIDQNDPNYTNWLNNENDYQPYYSSSTTIVDVKNRLQNTIKRALETSNVDRKINNLYPHESAIILGNLESVKSLLHQRVNIHDALYFSLSLGQLEIANYLLEVFSQEENMNLEQSILPALYAGGNLANSFKLKAPENQVLAIDIMDQILSLVHVKKIDVSHIKYLWSWATEKEALREMRFALLKKHGIQELVDY